MEGSQLATPDFAATFENIIKTYRDLDAIIEDDDALFDHPLLARATEQAKQLLWKSELPAYYRARTYMFLCLVTDDWDTAERYRTSAEFVWRMVRTGHLEQGAQDKKVESMLAELREGLDHLKVLPYETKPDSWYHEYDPHDEEDEDEEEVEVDGEEEDDEEEVEVVDEEEEVDNAEV